MIKRTFVNKSNTIFQGSHENYGLYPISVLNYGLEKSRILLNFDINEIKEFVDSCPKNSEIKHILKMTNCGSIDIKKFSEYIPSKDINGSKKRASSFYIYAFPIPNNSDSFKDNGYVDWDEGIGFDSNADFFISGGSSVSTEGSNWFNRKSGLKWEKEGCIGDVEREDVIAMQHFDHGNENLELDITKYINSLLEESVNEWSAHNDGICLSIEPHLDGDLLEENNIDTKYVAFFNNKTNTFFVPVIESRCNEYIKDDRYDFIIGKPNKLYLYIATTDGFVDLDMLPTCHINGLPYEVKKYSKGIYYIEIETSNSKYFDPEVIYEDEWSNICIGGEIFEPIIQEFVPKSFNSYLSTTPNIIKENKYEPSLSGINDDEALNNDEIRKVEVKYRIPYSTKYVTLNNTEYRLYSKDSNREIDVIEWDKINNIGNVNYFTINTSGLISGNYFVDIKVKTKYEQRIFKNVLKFSKINNITKINR